MARDGLIQSCCSANTLSKTILKCSVERVPWEGREELDGEREVFLNTVDSKMIKMFDLFDTMLHTGEVLTQRCIRKILPWYFLAHDRVYYADWVSVVHLR